MAGTLIHRGFTGHWFWQGGNVPPQQDVTHIDDHQGAFELETIPENPPIVMNGRTYYDRAIVQQPDPDQVEYYLNDAQMYKDQNVDPRHMNERLEE